MERMTLEELRAGIAGRRWSAVDAVRAALERAERANARLNCFLELFGERALARAGEIDAAIARGERVGPLAGVPIGLKDNICLDYGRTTCASRMLDGYGSPYSATAAARLIEAGAVVIGKTNMDEFAMGSSGENSAFGAARNPWDESRVPGGSSSGSASAVAAGVVPCALGSDTGGSIRQPAALCGLVGVKPTYGRVSRYGLVAFASSLDQIGPLTRTVRDAALVLSAICGFDPLDSTSADVPAEDFLAQIEEPVEGLRIGVPREARSGANHPAVAKALDDAAETFRDLGATIVDVELPHLEHGVAAYYIVAPAEASSNLARFDGVRYGRRAALAPGGGLEEMYARSRGEGFGAEVQRRIMLGTHVLSSGYYDAYYVTALKVRRLIKEDFDRCFARVEDGHHGPAVHAVLMPTAPGPAFRIGEKTDDPMSMYLEDVYTVPANLAGLPALSLPAGFAEEDGKRLPVGVQLIGPAFGEGLLLRVARMFERATVWHAEAAVGWL